MGQAGKRKRGKEGVAEEEKEIEGNEVEEEAEKKEN